MTMSTMLMKTIVMGLALTAAAAAHAQLSDIDGTVSPEAIAQAKGLQAQGLPANPGAPPSTYAEARKDAVAASAGTNQRILAELTRIDFTLRQMLELEQRQFMTSGH
jgi:hypothetical protein